MALYGQYNPMLRPNIGTRTPFRTMLDDKPNPWEELSMQRENQLVPDETEEDDSFLSNLRALQSRGAGPAESEYGKFLAQGVPDRNDYQRSKGAKIAAALISGIAGYTGSPAARYGAQQAQEGLDRPYEQAVERYGMTGKNLNEQAEREQSHYKNELDAAEAVANYSLKNKYERRQEERQDNQFKMQQEMESGRNTRADANLASLESRQAARDAAALARQTQADLDRDERDRIRREDDWKKLQALEAGRNYRDSTNVPSRTPTPTDIEAARNELKSDPNYSWMFTQGYVTEDDSGNVIPTGKQAGEPELLQARLDMFRKAVTEKSKGGRKTTKSAAPDSTPVMERINGKWVVVK